MSILQATTGNDLQNAVLSAVDGDVIEVAGNIGAVAINSARKSLRIVAKGSKMPVFAGIRITNSADLSLENLHFQYQPKAGDADWTMPFSFETSQQLTLNGCRVEGLDGPNGYGWGRGIFARFMDGFFLSGCHVTGFKEAVFLAECQNLAMQGTEVAFVAGDAVKCNELVDALFEGNHVHNFRADPADSFHRDAFQLSSPNAKIVSRNVTFRGNLVDVGDGTWSQGFFLGNQKLRGGGDFNAWAYRNFLIEENLIYGRHHHAITLEAAIDCVIRRNSALRAWVNRNDAWNARNADDGATHPSINAPIGAQNVVIEDNVSCGISGSGTERRNVIFDTKRGETYDAAYSNIKTSVGGRNDWKVIPGGKADGVGVTDMASPGLSGVSGSAPSPVPPPTPTPDPAPEPPVGEPPVAEPESPGPALPPVQEVPAVSFVYKSNSAKVGDGTRITRIWTDEFGIQHLAVMVDEKTERFSEVVAKKSQD